MLYCFAVFALAIMMLCWQAERAPSAAKLVLACSQDEDMKIAPDYPSGRPHTDYGECVALEFRRHKENGNISLANRLGEELAKPLLGVQDGLFGARRREEENQLYFLYGFAVRKAVGEHIDISILADTALHSFSETVENADGDIYDALNDSVADTIYRLCLHDRDGIGTGFAKLCGHDADENWITLGNETYAQYLSFATQLIHTVSFQTGRAV